jgi:hypothetical protein
MPNTFTKIASVTVGSGGTATIDFTSIPATYTDLVLKTSTRFADTTVDAKISINGSTTTFTRRHIQGNGTAVSSGTGSDGWIGSTDGSGQTASTFGNNEVYFPNYAGSTNKSYSVDTVSENNASDAKATLLAGLWSTTSAITSISVSALSGSANFVQYTTATLYGIKNS